MATRLRAAWQRLAGVGARLADGGQRRHAAAEARASARRWKTRATSLDARVEQLSGKLAALDLKVADARSRIAGLRREVSTPGLLRAAFHHRVATLAARTSGLSPAVREARLIHVSEPYRVCLAAGPAALGAWVHRMTLDGLTWWVPVKHSTEAPARSVGGQRFPYRGILQTRELTVGGVMLDVGANIGRMAIPRLVLGDVTAVYCAEPDPVSFACLAGNVVDNGLRGLVLPDQTAIGDRDGVVRLRRVGGSGSFHVVADADEQTVDVPSTTLDTWVERLHVDLAAVSFIKVDVEGFERRVVCGASRVLTHPHIAWQMEIKPAGLRRAGDTPADLYVDLAAAFTHFIDLNRRAAGPRVRPIDELTGALGYIEPDGKTDILLYHHS